MDLKYFNWECYINDNTEPNVNSYVIIGKNLITILRFNLDGIKWNFRNKEFFRILCRTPITIDMCYLSIPLCGGDIVKTSITVETRICARFGSTMIKYAFTSPPTKLGVKDKAIYGQITVHINR